MWLERQKWTKMSNLLNVVAHFQCFYENPTREDLAELF